MFRDKEKQTRQNPPKPSYLDRILSIPLRSLLRPHVKTAKDVKDLRKLLVLGCLDLLYAPPLRHVTHCCIGSVSKVEMVTPMALIYIVLFPSISTFETPPRGPTESPDRGRPEKGPRPVALWRVHQSGGG
jgi:hypothetical protein